LHQQDLLEGELLALFADGPVDGHEAARRDFRLMSAVLDDRVHIRHLCKRDTVQPKSLRCKELTGEGCPRAGRGYFSRTRVPLIFCELSAVRKFGTRRSISSKYEDSAGVF